MATATENKVLRVLADELEQIPVRGVYRPTLAKVIDAMREMGNSSIFESGRYTSLADITESARFIQAKRAKREAVPGNGLDAAIDPLPDRKTYKHPGRKVRDGERKQAPPITRKSYGNQHAKGLRHIKRVKK